MRTIQILCLAALILQGFACSKKKNPVSQGNVWQRMVGKDITTSPYSSGGDSPVDTGDQLSCNFEQGGCCWSNAASPTDQLDWEVPTGPTEDAKMQSSFGTTAPFSGSALGVATETGAGGAQQAILYSCPIACSDGSVQISLKHWQTKDVQIQVCQETDPAGPPSNCKTLPASSGSTDTVTLPGGENSRIVIIANGFTAAGGSVAMVDDIAVTFKQCFTTSTTEATTTSTTEAPTTTTTLATTTKPTAACKAIGCNFETGNTCSYTNVAAPTGGNKQWAAVTPPFQNPLTGIPKPYSPSHCAGVYLNPGDSAVMSTNVNFPAGSIVRFYGYRATEGIDLQACCDGTTNCPFSTTNQVQVSDYKTWKEATVTCPAGTSKLYFKAINNKNNFGAAGLDDIQVLSEVDRSPLC